MVVNGCRNRVAANSSITAIIRIKKKPNPVVFIGSPLRNKYCALRQSGVRINVTFLPQAVQSPFDYDLLFSGHMQIASHGFDAEMAQHFLNVANVGTFFQEVGREGMPEGVNDKWSKMQLTTPNSFSGKTKVRGSAAQSNPFYL